MGGWGAEGKGGEGKYAVSNGLGLGISGNVIPCLSLSL